jgi:hypothetical protein
MVDQLCAFYPNHMDYLRRTEAVLRRARQARDARVQAEQRAAQQAARTQAGQEPRRQPGRPPTPGGPNSYVRPADRMARAERAGQTQYQPSKPTYAHHINLSERGSGLAHARRMLDRIVTLSDKGGWTTSERVMLWRAKQIWQRRVDGKDARYLVVGNRRGRLTAGQAARIAELQAAIETGQALGDLVRELATPFRIGLAE